MTIASEISRLQGAKACIKASIENKGVTVGANVKLDSYSDCIDAIPTGSSVCFIDAFVLGGGGGGGTTYGGGGGAGGVVNVEKVSLLCNSLTVTVGSGGTANNNGGDSCISNASYGCVGYIKAYGGGAGGSSKCNGKDGGSGGGAGFHCYDFTMGGNSCGQQGSAGGISVCMRNSDADYGGGGGGYTTVGEPSGRGDNTNYGYGKGGWGSQWTKGYTFMYGGGGGAGGYSTGGAGRCGGGNGGGGSGAGSNATSYGSGGGGTWTSYAGGAGCQGVVIIRRPADGSYGFTTATGGNCCNCTDGWCTHMFTSSGTFTITG